MSSFWDNPDYCQARLHQQVLDKRAAAAAQRINTRYEKYWKARLVEQTAELDRELVKINGELRQLCEASDRAAASEWNNESGGDRPWLRNMSSQPPVALEPEDVDIDEKGNEIAADSSIGKTEEGNQCVHLDELPVLSVPVTTCSPSCSNVPGELPWHVGVQLTRPKLI